MNINFCKKCGAPTNNNNEYCNKCIAEMSGQVYNEPEYEYEEKNTQSNEINGQPNLNVNLDTQRNYCYLTFIFGLLSIFLNCCFIPSILCILFFMFSRRNNAILYLSKTEKVLSRIGFTLCILSIVIAIVIMCLNLIVDLYVYLS